MSEPQTFIRECEQCGELFETRFSIVTVCNTCAEADIANVMDIILGNKESVPAPSCGPKGCTVEH